MPEAPLGAPSHLKPNEANFVYNVEVLGLPVRKAAELAGLPLTMVSKPHLQQAREQLKREVRGTLQITKEDVVHGVHEAVGRARILGEPMTEIRGWETISKMLGFDQPQRVDINLRAAIDVVQSQVRDLSTEELVKMLGAGDVIDAEFYEVRK